MPNTKHVIDTEEPAPTELDIDPALVAFIIARAREFDVKVPPVEPDPGSNASDDGEGGILQDYPADMTETELRDAIAGVSQDAAVDLVAMLWLGRGDYTLEEWAEARTLAGERAFGDIAAYLMGEPNLASFLEEGFTLLGYEPEDYAQLV
jgi:hypothetical protein